MGMHMHMHMHTQPPRVCGTADWQTPQTTLPQATADSRTGGCDVCNKLSRLVSPTSDTQRGSCASPLKHRG